MKTAFAVTIIVLHIGLIVVQFLKAKNANVKIRPWGADDE